MTGRKRKRAMPVRGIKSAAWRQSFRRRLLNWFSRQARDLPWRRTHDPYAVWVSEIMLQQTQVATVEPYYQRFLERFPTLQALAAAPQQQVLRLWEGLGYYRRARSLHAAAKEIVQHHDGRFPENPEFVKSLPGIGRYTAGAILSIALDQRQPILEGNTIRLLSRLSGYTDDVTSGSGQKQLWAISEMLLPRKRVGTFNQALMELGALVCTPRQPKCESCPVMSLCQAYLKNQQDKIPHIGKTVKYEGREEAAVVIERRRRILLRHCDVGERWAGLWDFPRCQIESMQPAQQKRELSEKILQTTGLEIELGPLLTKIKHSVTRYRINLTCYRASCRPGARLSTRSARLRWIPLRELNSYPLSTTGRKIEKLLEPVA